MGKGTSLGIGIEMLGVGIMYSQGERIGYFSSINGSPLPISFTFSATTTVPIE